MLLFSLLKKTNIEFIFGIFKDEARNTLNNTNLGEKK